jgi:hypothetical protein
VNHAFLVGVVNRHANAAEELQPLQVGSLCSSQ